MSISKQSLTSKLSNNSSDRSLNPKISFTIRDTEFLIRMVLVNQIDGKDVEIASSVLKKVKKIHEKLILHSQEII